MIARGRPLALARKARLRADPRSGKTVLLYPERGLELSETAARIARLCQQGKSADAIVDELAAAHGAGHDAAARARIDAEVMAFLEALDERGLLAEGPGQGPEQGQGEDAS